MQLAVFAAVLLGIVVGLRALGAPPAVAAAAAAAVFFGTLIYLVYGAEWRARWERGKRTDDE